MPASSLSIPTVAAMAATALNAATTVFPALNAATAFNSATVAVAAEADFPSEKGGRVGYPRLSVDYCVILEKYSPTEVRDDCICHGGRG